MRSNEGFEWYLAPTAPERGVTRKEKKTKFFATWGQIPTDWIGAPPEDAGWGRAGRDLPFLGQTWKRRFTDVTNIFNLSGNGNTECIWDIKYIEFQQNINIQMILNRLFSVDHIINTL